MKAWGRAVRRGAALAVVTAAILVPAATVGAQESGDAECAVPRASEAAHQLARALVQYRTVQQQSAQACADLGIKSVLAQRVAAQADDKLAQAARDAGDLDQARVHAIQALAIDAGDVTANGILTKLAASSPHPYRNAMALYDAGYTGAARTLARKIASEVGASIPERLAAPGASAADQVTEWTTLADGVMKFAAALVSLFVIVALIGLALSRLKNRKQRVVIEKFDCADTLYPAAELTALVTAEFTSSGSGPSLRLVRDVSQPEPFDIAAVAGDQAKWAAALVKFLTRPNLVRVQGGAFQSPEGDDVAMSVAIVDGNGSVRHSRTFRQQLRGTKPQEALHALVFDAAAWTLFELDHVLGLPNRTHLGTKRWRSWGCFRRGVWRQELSDTNGARDAYHRAIQFDPENWGAFVNLANVDNLAGDPVRALELAGTAERLMRDEHDLAREPAHFRVMYTQATAYLQQAGEAKTSTEDATRASQHAVDTLVRLVTSCAAILAENPTDSGSPLSIRAKTRDDALEDLERTVQLFLPAAASALASAQAARDPSDVEVAAVEDVTDESRREAIATLREITFTTSSNTIVRALGKLFDDNQLPNAAHYNLACMYSWALPAAGTPVSPAQAAGARIVGTRALRHLRMACELPVTDERAEARKDPDLERLRAWNPTEFERITKPVEPQPAPPSRIARPGYWASRPR